MLLSLLLLRPSAATAAVVAVVSGSVPQWFAVGAIACYPAYASIFYYPCPLQDKIVCINFLLMYTLRGNTGYIFKNACLSYLRERSIVHLRAYMPFPSMSTSLMSPLVTNAHILELELQQTQWKCCLNIYYLFDEVMMLLFEINYFVPPSNDFPQNLTNMLSGIICPPLAKSLMVKAGVSVTWTVLSWSAGHEFEAWLGLIWGA